MKHQNLKITNLFIIMMLFFSFKGISQNTQASTNNIMETINASGNNATGSSGTVAYSIGQVFYTYIGQSVYNVAQGIQHEEINQITDPTEVVVESQTEIIIFPNPTTDFVTINIKGFDLEKKPKSYKLYDFQGRLLKQNTINDTETQINLSDLNTAIYILQVYVDNIGLKTFKILKK